MRTYPLILILVAAVNLGGCETAPQRVVVQPQPTFQVRPMYPAEMRQQQVGGEVVVDFVVDTEGRPVRVSAIKSTRKEFEAAAIAAVQKWRFKPGTIDGKPAPVHMAVPIVFSPNEGTPGRAP